MLMVFLTLCGCAGEKENSATRFLLDTVITLKAACDDETLDGAFALCAEYERLLSRTVPDSDVSRLNGSDDFVKVSDDTLTLLKKALYYSEKTGGKFDITICPVSMLWDFKNQVIPGTDEIAEALKNVDYHSIEMKEDTVRLSGVKIDLGGIAKGYIADRLLEYFIQKGVKNGIINLGGNVVVFGNEYEIGIQKPFGEGNAAVFRGKNISAVTSGIYERYIEKDGVIYHHILDPKTGYGVQNELASVTVIGKSSADCDALSTACILEGTTAGLRLINETKSTEAVFIDREGKITLSDGLYREGDEILFKE